MLNGGRRRTLAQHPALLVQLEPRPLEVRDRESLLCPTRAALHSSPAPGISQGLRVPPKMQITGALQLQRVHVQVLHVWANESAFQIDGRVRWGGNAAPEFGSILQLSGFSVSSSASLNACLSSNTQIF